MCLLCAACNAMQEQYLFWASFHKIASNELIKNMARLHTGAQGECELWNCRKESRLNLHKIN